MADDQKRIVTKKAPVKPAAKKTVTKKAVAKEVTTTKTAAKKTNSAPSAPAAKKVVTKKTAAAPATRPPASAKPAGSPPADKAGPVTPEQRYRMIEQAAYYKAEKRGFDSRFDAENWAEAEREVDEQIARGEV